MRATEHTFYELALADRIPLTRGASSLLWLTNRGHLSDALEGKLDAAAAAALRLIYTELGGDERRLQSKRSGSNPRPDFLVAEWGLVVEVDEIQHFTSDRGRTLDNYPPNSLLAFDLGGYRTLVSRWCTVADRYRATKPAADFSFAGGRRAQRAYFDAFRDLAAPTFGLRVLRVPAPECDGRLAYERFAAMISVAR